MATEITEAGGRSAGVGVDVTDDASLTELVGTASTRFGRLDVMCNHVGGNNPERDLDVVGMDMEEFDRTMLVNVRSTVLGCRLAIPYLIPGEQPARGDDRGHPQAQLAALHRRDPPPPLLRQIGKRPSSW